MARMQITKTELVWPGKYTDDGVLAQSPRATLPLQTAELFGPQTEWQNKLIWGDNLLVMGSLLQEYAGKINLIYIDPPFATGADFSFAAANGHHQVAYRDTWKISTGGHSDCQPDQGQSFLFRRKMRVTFPKCVTEDKWVTKPGIHRVMLRYEMRQTH